MSVNFGNSHIWLGGGGRGVYARDKNTSARLCAKNAGGRGAYARGGGVFAGHYGNFSNTSANLGEVDSIDDSSEERTLGACEIPSAVQCGQEQCSHSKQGMSPSLASYTLYRERKGMVSLQTSSCHHSRKLL